MLKQTEEYWKNMTKKGIIEFSYNKEDFVLIHDEKKYFLFDKSKICFNSGDIDNDNCEETIQSDLDKFGVFILALKNINNKDYLDDLFKECPELLFQQFNYVLSFCTFKSNNGKIKFKGRNAKK